MKTACRLLLIVFALALTGCQSDHSDAPLLGGPANDGIFTDTRDGHIYRWVRIGNQIWMHENLSYLPSVSPSSSGSDMIPHYYVYGYEGSSVSEAQATENYKAYGVLYNHGAIRIDGCPPGWHLPSDTEWKTLEKNLGMSNSDTDASGLRLSGSVGGQLKERDTYHWESPNSSATDSVVFAARGGGLRFPGGEFGYLRRDAFFWSPSPYDVFPACNASESLYRSVTYLGAGVHRNCESREAGFSVRCIKD